MSHLRVSFKEKFREAFLRQNHNRRTISATLEVSAKETNMINFQLPSALAIPFAVTAKGGLTL